MWRLYVICFLLFWPLGNLQGMDNYACSFPVNVFVVSGHDDTHLQVYVYEWEFCLVESGSNLSQAGRQHAVRSRSRPHHHYGPSCISNSGTRSETPSLQTLKTNPYLSWTEISDITLQSGTSKTGWALNFFCILQLWDLDTEFFFFLQCF